MYEIDGRAARASNQAIASPAMDPADRIPFAAMNADPSVMRYLPAALSPDESDALIARIEAHFDRHGFGLWAVEIPEVAPFAGFIGLSIPGFEAPFTPCVEIGWRLAAGHWGRGYATEGARAVLAFGFETLELDEIVSMTVPDNLRSRAVMERIGMVAQSGRRLRSPGAARGPQASPPCPLPNRTPDVAGGGLTATRSAAINHQR